ncbi:GxxExxY protein [Pollutibacter soli]|uniref:GxxExxY protein n=1 Tax=Pollutibacter soli TaxID=3034157 RepID=UPI003013A60E
MSAENILTNGCISKNLVLVEIKSVESLANIHHLHMLTYLKLSGKRLGLLINFDTDNISQSLHRKVNKLNDEN